jgi:hypothetical protein
METKEQTMDRFSVKTLGRIISSSRSTDLVDLSMINFILYFIYRDSLVYIVRLKLCVEF